MNRTHIFYDSESRKEKSSAKSRRRWIRILYVCSIGGISIGLLGLSISALSFFGLVANARAFNRAGTWLIVVAFPLVMFGAHAMDKLAEIDKKDKRRAFEAEEERRSYYPEKWKKND